MMRAKTEVATATRTGNLNIPTRSGVLINPPPVPKNAAMKPMKEFRNTASGSLNLYLKVSLVFEVSFREVIIHGKRCEWPRWLLKIGFATSWSASDSRRIPKNILNRLSGTFATIKGATTAPGIAATANMSPLRRSTYPIRR